MEDETRNEWRLATFFIQSSEILQEVGRALSETLHLFIN